LPDIIVSDEADALESWPTAIVADPGVAEAVAWAGAADGSTSLGADAQAQKTARVESEIIETQLKIRDLFKFVCLLVNLKARWGEA